MIGFTALDFRCIILFDGDADLPWHRSIVRYNDVIHMRKLIELGGLRVTSSFDELADAVRAYLADPSLDAAGRELSRSRECGPIDGHACDRIADTVAALVASTKSGQVEQQKSIAND